MWDKVFKNGWKLVEDSQKFTWTILEYFVPCVLTGSLTITNKYRLTRESVDRQYTVSNIFHPRLKLFPCKSIPHV